jgi:hypothetical protein
MKMSLTQIVSPREFTLHKFLGNSAQLPFRYGTLLLIIMVVSNLFTHFIFNPQFFRGGNEEGLYLLDKAAMYVMDTKSFESKVREVAKRLEVQPEWLMAVMYSESRFDASALNFKGSGAVGLIQFMPTIASELSTSPEALKNMNHEQQLEYVYQYLEKIRARHGGKYQSLTELYLAILYPKALSGDYCYSLYAQPSIAYKQNAGLDEDKDGRVTVSDIDRRMQRIFPTAYLAGKEKVVTADASILKYWHNEDE